MHRGDKKNPPSVSPRRNAAKPVARDGLMQRVQESQSTVFSGDEGGIVTFSKPKPPQVIKNANIDFFNKKNLLVPTF